MGEFERVIKNGWTERTILEELGVFEELFGILKD